MTARLRIAADRVRRRLIDAQRHKNGGGRPTATAAARRRKGRVKGRIPAAGTNAGTAGAMS